MVIAFLKWQKWGLTQIFLGIEVYEPGVGRLLANIDAEDLSNVRVIKIDAVEVLNHHIADHSLNRVQVYFPDPWPKKRHHKRRLIQPDFVALLADKLQLGGVLHCATDWEKLRRANAGCVIL